ncbi:phosphatase PAP2 family protein [Streptomyces sp. NPDC093510]|uniref:phosphatase PAP2 family protein n=1 Tax=Streptomyces sp. NPDC093510 TaxID=3155199 RepID=UPI003443C963
MDTMTDDLYRDITDFAHDTPSWFQHLAEVWTELGLLLFGVLFIVAWWRARRGDPRALAVAVLAPLATAVAYVCSELLKSVIDEERPCRAVSGALRPLVECPPHGDWSFPSNHSTIAGAAAIGLALAWPRIAALTVPMAVLMAFSRVFVGVHYPHDVAVGLVFGAVIVFVLVRLTTRPVARITLAMRGSSTGIVKWFAGPGPARPARPAHAASPAPAPAPTPASAPVPEQRPYDPAAYDPVAYDSPTMTFRRDDIQPR